MQPERTRLPDDRNAITRRFELEGQQFYCTVGVNAQGEPKELFIKSNKTGSMTGALLDALALSISIGLQYGVPLKIYTAKLRGWNFPPQGFAGEKFKFASSILDLIARWLEDKFQEAR